jgi:hypothetical protein
MGPGGLHRRHARTAQAPDDPSDERTNRECHMIFRANQTPSMRWGWRIGLAPVALLAGCGGSTPLRFSSSQVSAYTSAVHSDDIGTGIAAIPDTDLIVIGEYMCQQFHSGRTPGDFVPPVAVTVALLADAVDNLCPQYHPQLRQFDKLLRSGS